MPDTEDGYRRTMSMTRLVAEQNFVNDLLAARRVIAS